MDRDDIFFRTITTEKQEYPLLLLYCQLTFGTYCLYSTISNTTYFVWVPPAPSMMIALSEKRWRCNFPHKMSRLNASSFPIQKNCHPRFLFGANLPWRQNKPSILWTLSSGRQWNRTWHCASSTLTMVCSRRMLLPRHCVKLKMRTLLCSHCSNNNTRSVTTW